MYHPDGLNTVAGTVSRRHIPRTEGRWGASDSLGPTDRSTSVHLLPITNSDSRAPLGHGIWAVELAIAGTQANPSHLPEEETEGMKGEMSSLSSVSIRARNPVSYCQHIFHTQSGEWNPQCMLFSWLHYYNSPHQLTKGDTIHTVALPHIALSRAYP